MLVFLALLLLFVCAGILGWLFRNYVTAARRSPSRPTSCSANPEHRVAANGGRLVELARPSTGWPMP